MRVCLPLHCLFLRRASTFSPKALILMPSINKDMAANQLFLWMRTYWELRDTERSGQSVLEVYLVFLYRKVIWYRKDTAIPGGLHHWILQLQSHVSRDDFSITPSWGTVHIWHVWILTVCSWPKPPGRQGYSRW